MKNNSKNNVHYLSKCLIILSALSLFSCNSLDTSKDKKVEAEFTVSKFYNPALLIGVPIKSTISISSNAKTNSKIHVNVISSDTTIIESDKDFCDLTSQTPSCDIYLTGKAAGTTSIKFKSALTEYTSEKLTVFAEKKLSINGLDQPIITLGTTAHKTSVSLPEGTILDTPISVDITSEPADAVSITGSPCSLYNAHLSCDFTIKGEKLSNKVIISAKASDGKIATKEIKIVPFIKDISAGSGNTCLVDSTDSVYCWGSHYMGATGDGKTSDSTKESDDDLLSPQSTVSNLVTSKISSGQRLNLVITKEGDLFGWGSNEYGQLNQDSTEAVPAPINIKFPGKVSAVEVNPYGACAINKDDNKIYCCGGYNDSGQIGDGSIDSTIKKIYKPNPIKSDLTFSAISSTGGFTNCGLSTDNKLICWGRNGSGEIGIADHKDVPTPTEVKKPNGVNKIIKVSAGERHICIISDANDLYCWGDNTYGQLGNGTKIQSDTPQLVENIKFADVVAVGGLTCGIDITKNNVYCWGTNTRGGSLGDGETIASDTPIKVSLPQDLTFVKILAYNLNLNNPNNICVLSNNGSAYCWGRNEYGILGNGTRDVAPLPTLVKFM